MEVKRVDGVGLALAGGGWRAFSQVAALDSMEKNNIEIGAVAGTSMGSLVATLVAAGLDSTHIAQLLLDLDDTVVKSGVLKGIRRHVIHAITKTGFLDSALLESYIKAVLDKAGIHTFSDLKKPLAICTVDVTSGELVVFTGTDGYFARKSGTWTLIADNHELAPCVACSSAYPMVVSPMSYLGRTFVDGGCRMNLPTPLFDRSTVDAVVGVHMLHTYQPAHDLSLLNVMNTCMNYGSQQLEMLLAQAADVDINIPVDGDDTFKPGTGQEIIDFGYECLAQNPVDWRPARPSFFNMARRAGIDFVSRLLAQPSAKSVDEITPADAPASPVAAPADAPQQEVPGAAKN